MASKTLPTGYSGTQIFLHWAIAALVIFQLVFGEDIVEAYRAFRRGTQPTDEAVFDANIHVYLGIAVFVLAVWRIALRLKNGAPPAPAGESAIQKLISKLAHLVLYLAIFLMPISGGIAWFAGVGAAGEVHEIDKPVLIIFVTLHALGALYQHFVARSDVLVRMLKPVRRSV